MLNFAALVQSLPSTCTYRLSSDDWVHVMEIGLHKFCGGQNLVQPDGVKKAKINFCTVPT